MDEFIEDIDLEEDGESNTWITTFADMSMLLLVFFILLFSMSSLNEMKFQEAADAMAEALKGEKSAGGRIRVSRSEDGLILDEVARFRQIQDEQRKVFSDLQTYSVQKGLKGVVGAILDKGSITLRLPASVLFDSGKVELKPEGKKVLQEMKDFFIRHPDQKVNIRGYTDDLPPRRGSRFKDNWEISALRAINVLRYLISLGIGPERLTATGFADLNPIYPNNSEANRAKNRRVEFVLEKMIQ
ncbi:OmpA/MotB family protein [Desulfovulcanus sp.]